MDFFLNRCVQSLVGKKEAFWFNKAPKSLNFFVPKCNVKNKRVHGGKSKVHGK